jgi:hypothetical protein
LGETSGNDEKAATAFFLKVGQLENCFDGFPRRIFDKGASVDDEDISP